VVVRYRVDQLAATCDVSVDTVRYYQSRGLVPQPEREGRVAWYGPAHAERIRQIRSLQKKGLTLAAVERVVRGELGAADSDLAAAVAAERGEKADERSSKRSNARASAWGAPSTAARATPRVISN